MSREQSSTIKFLITAGLALCGGAAGLAALWPAALDAAKAQSVSLVGEAAQASVGEAEVDYRLATWLDPRNATAYIGLARLEIINGRADAAVTTLQRAGEGSEVMRLEIRTLIELGRTNEAANAAVKLTGPTATAADINLVSLAYALDGRTIDIETLVPRLSSPEAVQRARRIQAGTLPLAAELYATGLLRSSSALLLQQPTSFERNLLLARINYTWHTTASLNRAADLLTSAVALNPADLEAHQLLALTYRDLGKFTEASQQDALVVKLRAGRP